MATNPVTYLEKIFDSFDIRTKQNYKIFDSLDSCRNYKDLFNSNPDPGDAFPIKAGLVSIGHKESSCVEMCGVPVSQM